MKIKIGLFMTKNKAQVVLRKLIDATLTDFDLSRCEYDESEKQFTFESPYFWVNCMPIDSQAIIGRRFHFAIVANTVFSIGKSNTDSILSSLKPFLTLQKDIIHVANILDIPELFKEKLQKEAPEGIHSSSGDIDCIINSILLIKGVGYARVNFLK